MYEDLKQLWFPVGVGSVIGLSSDVSLALMRTVGIVGWIVVLRMPLKEWEH